MAKNKGGRPPKLTPETVTKLEQAFSIDATVEEACFFANISRKTYYEWIKDNPELGDRFDALRQRPVLAARQTVVDSLHQPHYAFEYLKRKRKAEFSDRQEVTGADGQPVVNLTDLISKKLGASRQTHKPDTE